MNACQAVCCKEKIEGGRFMCRRHWFALPAPLRQHINAAWRARQKAIRDGGIRAAAPHIVAHVEACDEARRWTAEGEKLLEWFKPDADRIRRLYALTTGAA